MGDGVNLAARLEVTVSPRHPAERRHCRGLDPDAPLRLVGRVIVKGKTEPVDIYTPEEDASCAPHCQGALCYRTRDWDGARRRRHPALRPGTAALHYGEIITEFRTHPGSVGWGGSAG